MSIQDTVPDHWAGYTLGKAAARPMAPDRKVLMQHLEERIRQVRPDTGSADEREPAYLLKVPDREPANATQHQ